MNAYHEGYQAGLLDDLGSCPSDPESRDGFEWSRGYLDAQADHL